MAPLAQNCALHNIFAGMLGTKQCGVACGHSQSSFGLRILLNYIDFCQKRRLGTKLVMNADDEATLSLPTRRTVFVIDQ